MFGGGQVFAAIAVLGPERKKVAMSPSSIVHDGQYGTKYVTFEYIAIACGVRG